MSNFNISLKTASRQVIGKAVKQLRKQGKIPAVLYGHNFQPLNLSVDYSMFEKVFNQAGESTLIDLTVDEKKPVKVLIQDYQFDPLSGQFIHVDFHQVRMDEKLHTKIELKFVGEAPAVKESAGILVTNIHALNIECLPQDLVHTIEVDLSSLKTFTDVIRVSDIKLPSGITVLNVPNDLVVLVQPPRSEKELEALAGKPETKLPEIEEKAEATQDKTPETLAKTATEPAVNQEE
jgi:large subunit ribosomal protein L25